MYICSSCVRLLAQSIAKGSSKSPKAASNASWPTRHRLYDAKSSSTRRHATVTGRRQSDQTAVVKRKTPEAQWDPGWRERKEKEIRKRDLLTELDYLRDPIALAHSVTARLREGNHASALDLVRVASSRLSCVVSWNHLIDYDMAKGRVVPALKTYQEMKKRAQPPDAHTFTILLRGLAMHVEFPRSLDRALAIYESMHAENSPVKPNIAHTNAVLSVCAKRADMDTMLGVAARLPSRGPAAADNRTYTLFFNTLRSELWGTNLEMAAHTAKDEIAEDYESMRRRQSAILKGRRMWCDVVERWSKKDIIVDEELVCSLGRLLLLGASSRDPDDVLSLVEQTMGIRRQIPPLGDPNRKGYLTAIGINDSVPLLEDPSEGTIENPDPSASSPNSLVSTNVQLSTPSPSNPSILRSDGSTSEFAPIAAKNILRAVVRPGRNTLSLLMDACIRLRAPQIANKYRVLLTDPSGPFKIVPDTENLHTYLRLLRQSRSSNAAASLVEDMVNNPTPGGGVSAKTFRIAMSACVRNCNHINAGVHAERILRLMARQLEEPDVKTCEMFLAVSNRKTIDWRERTRGLYELDCIIRNWRSLLAYGRVGSNLTNPSARDVREASGQEGVENDCGENESLPRADGSQNPRAKRLRDKLPTFRETLTTSTGRLNQSSWDNVRRLVIQVISLCDKAIAQGKEEIPSDQMGDLKRRRFKLIAWVGKHDQERKVGYQNRIMRHEIAGMGARKGEDRADEKEEDMDFANWDYDDMGLAKDKSEETSTSPSPKAKKPFGDSRSRGTGMETDAALPVRETTEPWPRFPDGKVRRAPDDTGDDEVEDATSQEPPSSSEIQSDPPAKSLGTVRYKPSTRPPKKTSLPIRGHFGLPPHDATQLSTFQLQDAPRLAEESPDASQELINPLPPTVPIRKHTAPPLPLQYEPIDPQPKVLIRKQIVHHPTFDGDETLQDPLISQHEINRSSSLRPVSSSPDTPPDEQEHDR